MTNFRRFILSAAPLALGVCMIAGTASANQASALCGSFSISTAGGTGSWTCGSFATVAPAGATFIDEFIVYNNDFSNPVPSANTKTVFTFTGGTPTFASDTLTTTGTGTSNPAVSTDGLLYNAAGGGLLAGMDMVIGGGPAVVTVGWTQSVNSGSALAYTGYAEVVYDYTPAVVSGTPEPATMFLMGSALVGIGLLRKRIKA